MDNVVFYKESFSFNLATFSRCNVRMKLRKL